MQYDDRRDRLIDQVIAQYDNDRLISEWAQYDHDRLTSDSAIG